MLSRSGASVTVGVLGLIASLPILGFLALIHRFAAERPTIVFGTALFVFLCAASAFNIAYTRLPESAFRARVAGLVAALVTYLSVATLYVVGVLVARDNVHGLWMLWVGAGLLFGGWYPTLCGLAAGWLVEGKILATSNNKLQRTRVAAPESADG